MHFIHGLHVIAAGSLLDFSLGKIPFPVGRVQFEVKPGRGGTLRSMHAMLQRYPECPEGLVLYSGPHAKRLEQKLRFVPLYYAGSLAELKGLGPAQK